MRTLFQRRWHLREIHEQAWCPSSLRDAVTDTLQFFVSVAKPFAGVEERLLRAIRESGATQVVDLCSGAGGPWPELARKLRSRDGESIRVVLTDRLPNERAFQRVASWSDTGIEPYPLPVDARFVPRELPGFRTLFTGFHHFTPADAAKILQSAAESREGIAVLEAQDRLIGTALFFLVYLPLTFLAVPFIRPLRWSRLFWTYVLPLLPLVITHDAVISCLRTYTRSELHELARDVERCMTLEIGQTRIARFPLRVTFLIATPSSVGSMTCRNVPGDSASDRIRRRQEADHPSTRSGSGHLTMDSRSIECPRR